ncbi:FAD-dependent oxidoreductase [Salinibacterium sp. ZJ454]|uniref:FAD-dependent oxidoreductase n=1 Tax=Salinibacterium sp. ZJ454 TaxID=2708339 RepID=UPI001420534A|nr:FAD-dependent oxidoreductase [Salinibacterium sp. ZJ454]
MSRAEDFDVDVVVIGSGAAGLSAALAAREAGAERVLIAESQPEVGGSSWLSSGVVMASGSRLQLDEGIEDSAEEFLHDYLFINHFDVSMAPVETLVRRSGETIDWLEDHGIEFATPLIYCGAELKKRGHLLSGGGQAAVEALHRHCRDLGVDIALGQRVDGLLLEEGRVVGVAGGGEEIRSAAVVVASGGFGANSELVAAHFPSAWFEDWSWYIGADGSQGDAIKLGAAVGAQFTGQDHGLRTLAPQNPLRILEAFQPGWAVLLDSGGRRYVDESRPYGVLDARTRGVGDRAFVVFDENAIRPAPERAEQYRNPYRQNWPGVEFVPQTLVADIVDDLVDRGAIHRGSSLPDLLRLAGVPERTAAAEIERYNEFAVTGEDRDQGKPSQFLMPIATAPFYVAEMRPAVVNVTAYGLRIDGDAQVLGETGAIPGLYAAGECTGGVFGASYVGSGNSLANCFTMGRVAGESAAKAANAQPLDAFVTEQTA